MLVCYRKNGMTQHHVNIFFKEYLNLVRCHVSTIILTGAGVHSNPDGQIRGKVEDKLCRQNQKAPSAEDRQGLW